MGARIVDGTALWTSKKMNKVPLEYRGEYANLLPLAEANGTFDPDACLVWRSVYAYNRPDISIEKVEKIIKAFEDADMIKRWTEGTKTWATFVGIEKEGRLPPPSRIYRYKDLPPNPPAEYTEPEGFKPAVQQKGLPFMKLIPDICRKVLGVRTEREEYYKKDLKELAEAYGGTEVVTAFEEWAKSLTSTPRNPVRDFLRVADGFLQNKIKPEDPALDALCVSLYQLGNNTFTGKYRQMLNGLLSEFSFLELEKAYKAFISNKDEYEMKFAVRDFCEGAAKTIILSARKKAESDAKIEEEINQSTEQARVEVEQELQNLEEEIEEHL